MEQLGPRGVYVPMRCIGSLLALGLLAVVPWNEARADCGVQGVDVSPSPGWARDETPTIRVGRNPTVFAFWRPDLEPAFEVVCEADGEALSYVLEELPSSSDTRAARIQVDSAACSGFVVRGARDKQSVRPREETHYEVDSELEPAPDRPRPVIVSAQRENKSFGCGPSSHLAFETNVRPAALRVEVEPGAHTIVVPLRLYDDHASPGDRGEFWLGRTMCRGPNLPETNLDAPMSVRVTALHADGSTDVGGWQKIRPPAGYRPGQDEVAYAVHQPPPPAPSAALEGATAPATEPGTDWRAWLWLLLAIPGALAAAWAAPWASSRRS